MRRDTYFCTTDTLVNGCKTIFYIRGSDQIIAAQEMLWGVKMTHYDFAFYDKINV